MDSTIDKISIKLAKNVGKFPIHELVEDLGPLQKKYVDSYVKHNGDLDAVSEDMMRPKTWCYSYPKTYAKIHRAIESRMTGIHGVKDMGMTFTEEGTISNRPQDIASGISSLEDRVKLLWKVANRAAGFVYDKEGNEVMMNPNVSVAAVRAITDITGEWAPKESVQEINVRDDRSVDEIRGNVEELLSEYQSLNSQPLELT